MPATVDSFAHGLVIGKFYPPHAGHHLLIDRAAAACRRVTVVVAAHPHETIPLAQRTAWLTAAHAGQGNVRVVGDVDPHPVDFADDEVWARHVEVFAAAVARAARADGLDAGAAGVDAVFSSEVYGQELARRFGARCVHVDVDRGEIPVSGTQIRDDLIGGWPWLRPAIRAGLALRVVVPSPATFAGCSVAAPAPQAPAVLADELATTLAERGGAWAATVAVRSLAPALAAFKVAARSAFDPGRLPARATPGDRPPSDVASSQRDVPSSAAGESGPVGGEPALFRPEGGSVDGGSAPVGASGGESVAPPDGIGVRGVAAAGAPEAVWTDGDFLELAAAEVAASDAAAAGGGPVVVAGTDATITRWWFQRCLGPRPSDDETLGRLDRLVDANPAHLYLLAADLPAPGLADHLGRLGHDVVVLVPSPAGGIVAAAVAAVDELVARSWRFADPLVGDPRDSLSLAPADHSGAG